MVGAVLGALRAAGAEENTLVLFTSDNGPWMIKGLSGGSVGLLYGSAAPYRNVGKGSTWEGGVRMPAFAYWKGQIQPQTRSSATVSSLDVHPTLAALAGAKVPTGLDGKDAGPVILGTGSDSSPHDVLFLYASSGCARHSKDG